MKFQIKLSSIVVGFLALFLTTAFSQVPNPAGPIALVQTVPLTNALYGRIGITNMMLLVRGDNVIGDGGGGVFAWLHGDTNTADNIRYFAATNGGNWYKVSYWDDAAGSVGSSAGTNVFVNGVLMQPARFTNNLSSDTGRLMWYTNSSGNILGYATNVASSSFSWEGIPITNPNLKDLPYIYWVPSGSDLRAYIVANSVGLDRLETMANGTIIGRYDPVTGDPQYITIGANLNLDPGTGVLSATAGTAATNGTPLSVDAGTVLSEANLQDSSEIDPTVSGTNITLAIVGSSIATNKVNSTFLDLLLNQHKVNAWTLLPLILTNNLSSDAGRVVHYTNANGHIVSYATNLPAGGGGGGAGTNVFVNGILVQPAYFTNTTEVLISTNGNGHIVFDVNNWDGFWSDLTNSLVASNNVTFAYDGAAQKLMISATSSGGSGAAVTVDGGVDNARINFEDSTGIGFSLSGTNASAALVDRDFGAVTVSSSGTVIALDDGTVTSNKVVASNITIDKLSASGTPLSTNFLAGDYAWKQVTTNMIPGLNAILNTIGTGGGGGAGTNIFVNNILSQPAKLTNSTTLVWSTNSNGDIIGTVTNVSGTTTDNVVQRTGYALFSIDTGYAMQNLSVGGVITNATVSAGGISTRGLIDFAVSPSRSSTNYVVHWEIEGEDPTGLGSPNAAIVSNTKTTTSFQLAARFDNSERMPNGVKYIIWIEETVSVGGSGSGGSVLVNGSTVSNPNFTNSASVTFSVSNSTNVSATAGDVYLANSQTLTGTNKFSGPIWFKPYSKRVVLWDTDFVVGNGISSASIALPWLQGAAIASGTAAVADSLTNNQGIVRLSSTTSANSGYYYHSSVSQLFAVPLLTFESITRVRSTNDGVRVQHGFSDSVSTTTPTDAMRLWRSNNFLLPQVYNNSSLTQGYEYPVGSNQVIRVKIQVQTNMTEVSFSAYDSSDGTLILSTNITGLTLPATASRLFGGGYVAYFTNNVAVALEELDWSTAYIDTPVNR